MCGLALVQACAVAKALPELPRIWQNRGLHPGNKFQDWVKEQLEGIENVAGLHEAMSLDRLSNKVHLREGVQRSAEELAGISRATLKLVASDISTQTKVVFPDMANLYYAVSGGRLCRWILPPATAAPAATQ